MQSAPGPHRGKVFGKRNHDSSHDAHGPLEALDDMGGLPLHPICPPQLSRQQEHPKGHEGQDHGGV